MLTIEQRRQLIRDWFQTDHPLGNGIKLGISSINLDATEIADEDNGNLLNAVSSAIVNGAAAAINGVSFNRDTLNQSYGQQIAASI